MYELGINNKLLHSKTEQELVLNIKGILSTHGITGFTIWAVISGTICQPVANVGGIENAVQDIYDLNYGAESAKPITIGSVSVAESLFIENDANIYYAITFATPLGSEERMWLLSILPVIALLAEKFHKSEQRINVFASYQSRLNFISHFSEIFRYLNKYDIAIKGLNIATELLSSDVACAYIEGRFVGIGITESDFSETFIGNTPLSTYLKEHTDSHFIDQDCRSDRFMFKNLFVVRKDTIGIYFYLFNVTPDLIPDREFFELIDKLFQLAIESADYHNKAISLQISEAEMTQAGDILNQFVSTEIPVRTEINLVLKPDIFMANYPASTAGGDFATMHDEADGMFVCVADVCGKGYTAAVFTVMLATIMDSGIFSDYRHIKEMAEQINNYIIMKDFKDRFITGFFGYYHKITRQLNYVSCGHEPVLLLRGGDVEWLTSEDLPIGILRTPYTMHTVDIVDGDMLLLYTDGVTGYVKHPQLADFAIAHKDESPKDIVNALYRQLVVDPASQSDDFTCAVLKF